jgi:hypothetical protein
MVTPLFCNTVFDASLACFNLPKRLVAPLRYFGCSVNAGALSVRTVWIQYGNVKDAP